jgi:protein-disulfide isomerase
MTLPLDEIEDSEKIAINKSSFTKIIVGIMIAISAATFFAGFVLGSSSDTVNSDYMTKSDMESLVATLEKKIDNMPAPTQAQERVSPSAPSVIQVSLDDDPFKGDPNAPITIVEFSDFQCPFCSRFVDQTLSSLVETYIDTGKVKFVYRDLPLESIHPNAKPTHIAAECADEQGKFWDYHDILFENQAEWSRLSPDDLLSKLNDYATKLELNTVMFESCLSSQKIADEVDADIFDARKYGATGTPTFFIGNEKDGFVKLTGAQPFTSFKSTIDKMG